MKVISLHQPWATLVVLGEKKIETRGWYTNVRGNILIHAAKKFELTQKEITVGEPFNTILAKHGFIKWSDFALGAIIGMVEITDCQRMVDQSNIPMDTDTPKCFLMDLLTEQEKAFGHYEKDRYAWLLNGAEKFAKPIPTKGFQRFWNYEL